MPSLEALCERAAVRLIGPGNVCAALTLAEALAPAASRLRAAGLHLLAERLPSVLAADAGGFAALPVAVLEALLQGQSLVRTVTLVLCGRRCVRSKTALPTLPLVIRACNFARQNSCPAAGCTGH